MEPPYQAARAERVPDLQGLQRRRVDVHLGALGLAVELSFVHHRHAVAQRELEMVPEEADRRAFQAHLALTLVRPGRGKGNVYAQHSQELEQSARPRLAVLPRLAQLGIKNDLPRRDARELVLDVRGASRLGEELAGGHVRVREVESRFLRLLHSQVA